MPLDVYVASTPSSPMSAPLLSAERASYVTSARCESVQRERYFVWRLLEFALRDSLGLDPSRVEFRRSRQGGFEADGFYFSLSHTDGALAVAVSREPCGVDIELLRSVPNGKRIAERAFTEEQLRRLRECREEEAEAQVFFELWTAHEAEFKRASMARDDNHGDGITVSRIIDIGGRKYALSAVGSDFGTNIKFIDNFCEASNEGNN